MAPAVALVLCDRAPPLFELLALLEAPDILRPVGLVDLCQFRHRLRQRGERLVVAFADRVVSVREAHCLLLHHGESVADAEHPFEGKAMLAQGFLPFDKNPPKLVGDILPFGRYGIRDHLVGPFDGVVDRSGR